jgi:chromosome segregation ATPase
MVDFTATTALAIAKAKTEIADEIAQELASLKKQIIILSNTITKKDVEIDEYKKEIDGHGLHLRNAKKMIDSAGDRVSKAEAKASEHEIRANRLVHDLNRVEDELRTLKRDNDSPVNGM